MVLFKLFQNKDFYTELSLKLRLFLTIWPRVIKKVSNRVLEGKAAMLKGKQKTFPHTIWRTLEKRNRITKLQIFITLLNL